jgi:hypothetical protein
VLVMQCKQRATTLVQCKQRAAVLEQHCSEVPMSAVHGWRTVHSGSTTMVVKHMIGMAKDDEGGGIIDA